MVSSANNLMLLLIESGMPLIDMRNRQGPIMDPCGTPDNTGQAPDYSPSRTTLCDLPDKKDLIHAILSIQNLCFERKLLEQFINSLYSLYK